MVCFLLYFEQNSDGFLSFPSLEIDDARAFLRCIAALMHPTALRRISTKLTLGKQQATFRGRNVSIQRLSCLNPLLYDDFDFDIGDHFLISLARAYLAFRGGQ